MSDNVRFAYDIKLTDMQSALKKEEVLCRICLTDQPSQTVSIFKDHNTFSIHNEIMAIANVIIDESDGFPNHICLVCLDELVTAWKFKSKCEASDCVLRNSIAEKNALSCLDNPIKHETENDDSAIDNYDAPDFPSEDSNPSKDEKMDIGELLKIQPTSEGTYQCDLCKEFFKSKCKLKVHFKKLHIPRTFTCNTCKKVFKSIKTYRRHEKRNDCEKFTLKDVRIEGEGRNRMYYCHLCTYKSDRMVHMRNHIVVHTKEKPFKCNLCDASYTQRGNLYHHKYMKHDAKKIIFPCDRCGKVLYSKPHLRRHLKTHVDPSHECPICKRKFKLKEGLRVHMVRHKGEKNFSCETCGSSFFTHAELCNHKKYHLTTKRYVCDLCPYATQRKDTLISHRSKHSPENPFPCIICGRLYPTIQKLEFHSAMHSKEKEVQCPFCDKKFLQKRSLRKHLAKKHADLVDSKKVILKNLIIPKKEINESNTSIYPERTNVHTTFG